MSNFTRPKPPPPGTNSLAIIGPNIQSLMIGHTFLVLLIPLLVALFYYSTPHNRRQPIFILNALALSLAFAVASVSDVVHIYRLLSPQTVWPTGIQLIIGGGGVLQSILADAILLVRLVTVYPLSRIGIIRFTMLMFLPVTLKVARAVNLVLYIYRLSVVARGPNGSEDVDVAWLALAYIKVEWIAQVVDNSYASITFLWAIRSCGANTTPVGLRSALSFRQSSFAERLRILFHLALSNFIIPTLISIVQLALLSRIGASNAIILNDIAFVNSMVSTFGLVFATVWAGKEHRREEKAPNSFPLERERWNIHAGEAESESPGIIRTIT